MSIAGNIGAEFNYTSLDQSESEWLDSGNNAWQLTAASLVGLQSMAGMTIMYIPFQTLGKESLN